MAKKQNNEVAKSEPKALVKAEASPELLERISEVQENIDAVENFQLPKIKMTSEGMEIMEDEEPVNEIEAVILHAKKTNVYYSKPYNPSDIQPPDCFSLDGKLPDASIKSPQNTTCKGCPQAEFGTNTMKSGKACRNLKPLYLLLSDEAILPRQLTVSPTSLKAADRYLMDLTERGINYRKVKTKITAFKDNSKDTYSKLKFQMLDRVEGSRLSDIEVIREKLLPIMNRQGIEQGEMEPQAKPNQNEGEF